MDDPITTEKANKRMELACEQMHRLSSASYVDAPIDGVVWEVSYKL
jgi:hypothetical protein